MITPANFSDSSHREAAEKLYDELTGAGIDVLLDDRDERPGVKFKDADLIGIPYRITIGKKLKENKIEFFTRKTKQSQDVALEAVVNEVKTAVMVKYSE